MHASVFTGPAPEAVRVAMSALPLFPLGLFMDRLAETTARRHPRLFARLDGHAEKTFLLDPTDLPMVFKLQPRADRPSVEPLRRTETFHWDARIAGPLAALIAMIHGAVDGDALFFSRDIVIEGDTEAVLALRNAIDDAEMDLAAEAAEAFGPAAPLIERAAAAVLPTLSRLTGLALTRIDER